MKMVAEIGNNYGDNHNASLYKNDNNEGDGNNEDVDNGDGGNDDGDNHNNKPQ